jgi:hypothetical protein
MARPWKFRQCFYQFLAVLHNKIVKNAVAPLQISVTGYEHFIGSERKLTTSHNHGHFTGFAAFCAAPRKFGAVRSTSKTVG